MLILKKQSKTWISPIKKTVFTFLTSVILISCQKTEAQKLEDNLQLLGMNELQNWAIETINQDVKEPSKSSWEGGIPISEKTVNKLEKLLGAKKFKTLFGYCDKREDFYLVSSSVPNQKGITIICGGGLYGYWGIDVGAKNFIPDGIADMKQQSQTVWVSPSGTTYKKLDEGIWLFEGG
ncbi:hypothetical protein NIES4074_09830 [Cylindrospermum sp. NIES-4074]|nr:hypothetical protein NIES4074_09830 [Cylindrospermum sp. NIES-4074]